LSGGNEGNSSVSGSSFPDLPNNEPVDFPEELPEFIGGYQAFKEFIQLNTIYPEPAKDIELEGTVYVGFVVEKDGSITDVKVLRGVHSLLDKEAVRVVKLMPKWKPGRQNGYPVRVRYNVPISFALN